MTVVEAKTDFPRVIQVHRWARNGSLPDGSLYAAMTKAQNHIQRYAGMKEFFSWGGRRVDQTYPIFTAGGGAGPSSTYRGYGHVGHGVRYLYFETELARNRGVADISRIRWAVTPAGGATSHTPYVTYGTGATVPLDVPDEVQVLKTWIAVDEDTTYAIELLAYDEARPVGACVYEVALPPDDANGYYTKIGHAVGSPIYDAHRAELLAAGVAFWQKNASPIWSWSTSQDSEAVVRTLGTYRNVIDGSSTAHSASSAGITVDLTYRTTYNRTTVPAVFAVFGQTAGGGGGKAKLINAAGDVVAITTIGVTKQWYATTVNLATGSQKLDLMIAGDGLNQCSLWASSLFQKE